MSETVNIHRKFMKFLVVIYVLLVLNLRPALLGQMYNELFLLIPMTFISIIFVVTTRGRVRLQPHNLILAYLVLLFALWLVVQIVVSTPKSIYVAVVLGVSIFVLALSALISVQKQFVDLILRTLIYFIVLLSTSQLLTYLLFAIGVKEQILITEFVPSADYAWLPTKLFFPFTITLHEVWVAGIKIERSVGIFREPGLYQMYIIISYFALDFVNVRYQQLFRALLLASLFLTVSTAGYAIFLACMIYKQLVVNRRNYLYRFVVVVAGIILLILFANVPWFGLLDKMERNIGRTTGVIESFQLLAASPVVGYGVVGGAMDRQYGVSLLASVHSLGIIGLGLYAALTLYAIRHNYTRQTLVLWLPLFATLLVSQPLFEKGIAIFMLFLNTTILISQTQGRVVQKRQQIASRQPLLVNANR